jgi:hypothetical protein
MISVVTGLRHIQLINTLLIVIFSLGENGAMVVCNLAPTVFRPLVTEGLHLKNYQLYSSIMRTFKKILK